MGENKAFQLDHVPEIGREDEKCTNQVMRVFIVPSWDWEMKWDQYFPEKNEMNGDFQKTNHGVCVFAIYEIFGRFFFLNKSNVCWNLLWLECFISVVALPGFGEI